MSVYQIFDEKFQTLIFNYNSFQREDIFINNEYYCARVIFSKTHINHEYSVTTNIKDIRIQKSRYILRNHLKYDAIKKIYDISSLTSILLHKTSEDSEIKIFDPAKHDDAPLYDLARDINTGARLIIVQHEETKHGKMENEQQESGTYTKHESVGYYILESELGISLQNVQYVKDKSLIIILPYENATISHWKLFKEETGWEGIHCTLFFDKYLYPFPLYRLECKLYDKSENHFFTENITIKNDEQLVYKFLPSKELSKEIYKVEVKLFENDLLIDDYSGHPLRKINITSTIVAKSEVSGTPDVVKKENKTNGD